MKIFDAQSSNLLSCISFPSSTWTVLSIFALLSFQEPQTLRPQRQKSPSAYHLLLSITAAGKHCNCSHRGSYQPLGSPLPWGPLLLNLIKLIFDNCPSATVPGMSPHSFPSWSWTSDPVPAYPSLLPQKPASTPVLFFFPPVSVGKGLKTFTGDLIPIGFSLISDFALGIPFSLVFTFSLSTGYLPLGL